MNQRDADTMAAREAAWRDAEAEWLIDSQKPLCYRVGEIADALARKLGRLEVAA
jgi:hypothetical protein